MPIWMELNKAVKDIKLLVVINRNTFPACTCMYQSERLIHTQEPSRNKENFVCGIASLDIASLYPTIEKPDAVLFGST